MDTGTIRRVRWVAAALALTAAGTFLAWAILFGINLHARFQAQSVAAAVRSMQVGSTTLEESRPLLERYRASTVPASFTGQYLADTGFYINVGHANLERLGERFYFLRYAGLAFWGAGAEMYFRNGRLCELRFSVGTEVSRKGKFREGFSLTTEQSLGKNEFVMSGGHVTGGSRYMFTRVHHITLPADATPAERAHAFAYDLSCVTRLGGCRDVSQVLAPMPIRQDLDARHLITAIPLLPSQTAPVAQTRQLHRIRVNEDLQKAKLIHVVAPLYPPLTGRRVDGTVVLHVIVGQNGSVKSARYVSGLANLRDSAVKAVLQWRYKPTLVNNSPVEVDTMVSVVFPPLSKQVPEVSNK